MLNFKQTFIRCAEQTEQTEQTEQIIKQNDNIKRDILIKREKSVIMEKMNY